MEAEKILKRIGYDNDSITTTEQWIAESVYKLAMEDATALRQPPVIGSVCPCGRELDEVDIQFKQCYECGRYWGQTDL